jgi:hypothetical protein
LVDDSVHDGLAEDGDMNIGGISRSRSRFRKCSDLHC